MSDTRHKNVNWNLGPSPIDWRHVDRAILMDIRDELQQANRYLSTLHCSNFQRIPKYLRAIASRKRRARKAGR